MSRLTVALDGPSGSGKSSLAKAISEKLNIRYLDTGAIYRTVGLYMLENGIDPKDSAAVCAALPSVQLELKFIGSEQRMLLNGVDVSGRVHDDDVSSFASDVSRHRAVRDMLIRLQRNVARDYDVIMDGRDIGTVILPDATVKIFLTAPIEVRARRRYLQLIGKGFSPVYEEVLSDMRRRDFNDSSREIAPSVAASDAIVLDNGELDERQTLDAALRIIAGKSA